MNDVEIWDVSGNAAFESGDVEAVLQREHSKVHGFWPGIKIQDDGSGSYQQRNPHTGPP